MPQIINSNVASLNAQRNLNTSQNSLNTSLTRLSSGLRINSAKDDAAGLAISERMTSQIRGLNQAVRNANDGISLAQTAEGALGEIGNNLQRIRELAVQSANASNSASDRASLQKEVTQLTAEITRVASQTQFNGLNLLDGSFQSQSFQVGANANQTIDISSILDARSTGLGSHTLTTGGSVVGTVVSGATANGIGQETDLALTTNKGTVGSIGYAADAGADAIAAAINDAASGIGITANATNSTTLGSISAAGTISFNLTGGTGAAQAISVDITDTNDLSALAAAINGVQNNTGITATFTTAGDKSELTLSTTDGRDIIIDTYDGGAGETIDFGGTTLDDGTAQDSDAVAVGTVELTSSEGQIIATNAETDVFTAATDTSSFQSLALTDISSSDGAQTAIEVLDAALSQINTARADLGAIQNRFSSTIANLQSASENLSASRSRIQDADFASETANMTRGQILQQAGVAILAQANSLPNNVLSLLR
ncbi:MAG: flagellin [Nitrosomonas sp.]|nr:MAG: flagellin [Nitrosomonas sp.]